jgi:hypothetical protein
MLGFAPISAIPISGLPVVAVVPVTTFRGGDSDERKPHKKKPWRNDRQEVRDAIQVVIAAGEAKVLRQFVKPGQPITLKTIDLDELLADMAQVRRVLELAAEIDDEEALLALL